MSYVYEHPKLKNRNRQVAIRDKVAYLAGKMGHQMRHNYDVTLTTYTGVCRLCGDRFVFDLATEHLSEINECAWAKRPRLRRV